MRSVALLFSVALCGIAGVAQAETPAVVTSIKPLHSLVASVMAGVGEPDLLVRGNASPHTYALRPSDARALEKADVIFWMGPNMETFLTHPLETMPHHATIVALMDAKGMTVLPAREGGVWEPHDHGHHDEDHDADHGADHDEDHGAHHHEDEGEMDPHAWLSPDNARAMVNAIAATLEAQDAEHAATYQANAAALLDKLAAVDAENRALLAPVKDVPFVVFHDAYQYFEKAYGLNGVGSITVNPDQRPSAQRVAALHDKIASLKAACVFAEPQFPASLVDTIVQGSTAQTGTLDPEGTQLPQGPDLFVTLLKNNAVALADCLGGE